MRISYDPKADVLLIRLAAKPPIRAKDLWPDAILHFDAEGKLAEIEVLHASAVCDAKTLAQYRMAAA
ncbi:MAG: DUF2283 domain-containing protein [Chloroflexi bacterium]|nr:DUF2283 domain-containing protein [Chloroflexota bacterium]